MTKKRVRCRPRPRDDNEAYDSEYASLVRRAVTLKSSAKRQPAMGRSHCCREIRKEPESTEPSADQWNEESVEGYVEDAHTVSTSKGDVYDTGKLREHDWEADVFQMYIPKRRRSKRKTTVVHMSDFNFQKLPSLLNGNRGKTTPSTSDKKEKTRRKPRKQKSNAKPKRLLLPSTSSEERRTERRRRRRTELDAFQENEKEGNRPPAKRRARPPLFADDADRTGGFRRRSLRSVIEECVDGKSTPVATAAVEKPPEEPVVLYPSLGSTKKSKSETGKDGETFIESNHRQCPTVGRLLKKGTIRVGDYVELMKQDSVVAVQGWVTHRGLLCAHCALVHSCKNFGACAGSKLTACDQLQIKDGRNFKQLLR